MNYLLYTNIIVSYSRQSEINRKIEDEYQLFGLGNNLAISIVSVGELNAIKEKFNLGKNRRMAIDVMIGQFAKLNIDTKEILNLYGKIDAFSQGKSLSKSSKFSSRNMGKNDLWIAATASAYDLTLVTMDKDFEHLDGVFLNLEFVDIELFR
ncbi:MAG: PIN domain-containing protein [Bacteroidota bacterium]